MGQEEPSVKDMLEHGWRCFSLHAAQRISLFNFFLVVSGSITAVLAASLQQGGLFSLLGVGLGSVLVLVSFIFWKLDQRTAFLVKHGEAGIIELESALPVATARLVSREPVRTAAKERGFVLSRMWTYGTAFRVVFTIMGLVGAAGAIVSWCKYKGWLT